MLGLITREPLPVVESSSRDKGPASGQLDKPAQQAERMSNGASIREASYLVKNVLAKTSRALTQQLHDRQPRFFAEDHWESNPFLNYYAVRLRTTRTRSS
jgi:hypothetical protein